MSIFAFLIGYPLAIIALVMAIQEAGRIQQQGIAARLFFGTLFFALIGVPGILPLWFGLRGPKA